MSDDALIALVCIAVGAMLVSALLSTCDLRRLIPLNRSKP